VGHSRIFAGRAATLSKAGAWALAFLFAVAHTPALAQDDIPATSGFSGFILFGVGYVNVESNLIVTGAPLVSDVGSTTIESIFAKPQSGSSAAVPTAGELNYTFAGTRTQLFFGNRLEDVLRLDVVFGLGVRQELPDASILAASVLFTPALLKLWSDPYIEGEDRQRTELNFPGFRLRWGRILRTGLELTVTDRFYGFDEEKSGDWLISEGRLDPDQQPLLERDGYVLRLQALYRVDVRGHRFEPALRYVNDKHKGAAIANSGFSLRLTYLYRSPKIVLDANLALGQREAEQAHPVYGKVLDTDRFGAAFTAFIPVRLFGKSGWSVWASVEFFKENANIDFFESSAGSVMAGFAWRHRRP
jgi:hypothetical protein